VRRNSVLVLKLILKVDVAMVVRALLHTTTMRINYHRQRGSTTGRLDYKRAIIVRGNSVVLVLILTTADVAMVDA
jgi:hypothetical protein